jgi:hypothetical protein
MTTPIPARGSHVIATRIRSLAVTNTGSVFAALRPDKINEVAQAVVNAQPFSILSDEELRNAVLNVKNREYFAPKNEIEANARGQRFERIEVSTIGEAVKQMTPAERLDHVNSKKMPSRFVIAPKIMVRDIAAALACCTDQQRLHYQETYMLPDNIVVAEKENANAAT